MKKSPYAERNVKSGIMRHLKGLTSEVLLKEVFPYSNIRIYSLISSIKCRCLLQIEQYKHSYLLIGDAA